MIEGEWIDYRFSSDSLPLVQLRVYDNYQDVHDWIHHSDPRPFWRTAEGGSGINARKYEFTFVVKRLVCDMERWTYSYDYDTIKVTQADRGTSCWLDEDPNGLEGVMWIDFENLYAARPDVRSILPLQSGDILEVLLTKLFDDPDYGQGSQRVARYGFYHSGVADTLIRTYGIGGNPDPNYGVRSRSEASTFGDAHVPVDRQAAMVYDDASTGMVDTLAMIRIDLAGPVAPDSFFYPPDNWVTSDTQQVISVDLYDQIGCPVIDQSLTNLEDFVAGVYAKNFSDASSKIAINIVVRNCDGSYHPGYIDDPDRPWEGKTWSSAGWSGARCDDYPQNFEKINGKWGTRVTFHPNHPNLYFNSGDKVCVTIYAWDNAVPETCPSNINFTTVTGCGATVDNYIPGRNEGVDRLDPDWLTRTTRQICRFSFYVDNTPPKVVEANLENTCNDTMTVLLEDQVSTLRGDFCSDYAAGFGAADVRLTIYDDAGAYDDVFFNDLYPGVPIGEAHTAFLNGIPGREGRYIRARIDYSDVTTSRQAILKIWRVDDDMSCSFFEPGDSVQVDIYACDNPNVPWYGSTWRPHAEDGFHAGQAHSTAGIRQTWNHYYSAITGDNFWLSTCNTWRRPPARHTYTWDFDANGVTQFDTLYQNYENPNWGHIYSTSFRVNSEIYVKDIRWFNDDAYTTWNLGEIGVANFFGANDLVGIYRNVNEITDTSDAEEVSVIGAYDPNLKTYARDLQFLEATIYTCTDSLIDECVSGSSTPADSVSSRAPFVKLELYNAAGRLVWKYSDYYCCHCPSCLLRYEPDRDRCKDEGTVKIGPIYQIAAFDSIARADSVLRVNIHPDSRWEVMRTRTGTPLLNVSGDTLFYVYGYMDGDSLAVTFSISSRTPNMFGDETERAFHEYRWFYKIDMNPPNGRFRRLEGTTGYAEVDCYTINPHNGTVRVRLEDMHDAGVGMNPGGTDPDWSTSWPIPAIEPGSDWLKYEYGTTDGEPADLVWATGTGGAPHYTYTYLNENHPVLDCADEDYVARTMILPDGAVSFYSGLDDRDAPVITTVTEDTIWIADSMYAVATIQDKLGNKKTLNSTNLGLDNGLPEVKGFAFSTYNRAFDTFEDWDRDYCLLPWEHATQESLVGIYNYGAVCTVFVRLWFNDNMDMREADPSTGYTVRFQPEGWTHWFPVIPLPTHATRYPLAARYVNYDYSGSTLLRTIDSEDPVIDASSVLESTLWDNGWNTDREWIGYMVIAGTDMDGVATLRVQGYDDNAGNRMLERDFIFRIESTIEGPVMIWPEVEHFDPADPMVVTGFDQGDFFCSFERHSDCFPLVSGNFDRTITDSVVFEVWWGSEAMDSADYASRRSDFHYKIDDMFSAQIFRMEGSDLWWANVPCTVLDILHQYGDRGTLRNYTGLTEADNEKYLSIRFRGYSRFYEGAYIQAWTENLYVDNYNASINLTTAHDGGITPGWDLIIVPSATRSTKVCITGADISKIDYANFYYEDMVTGTAYPLTDAVGPRYDDQFVRVGREGIDPVYYNEADNVVCYDWTTPPAGIYRICGRGYEELHVVGAYVDGAITDYNTYTHNYCFCRDSVLVPSACFFARGDNYDDAIRTVVNNYPGFVNNNNIYPWANESVYPDWPAWVNIDTSIVDGYPYVNWFQILTFNNPDWTEGSDPFQRSYTETGGYPGDSIYVLFKKDDALYIDLRIEDEHGGDISGSNRLVDVRLDDADLKDYQGSPTYVYNWILDDQDNRYDGVVKVTVTTYRRNFSGGITATDNVTFVLLDTSDPKYKVTMTRHSGVALATATNPDYPRETIWVTNADTVNIFVNWNQTIYDQSPFGESYFAFDAYEKGRVWEHLRITMDGQPHEGFRVDDPNDLLQARLWQVNYDGGDPFWLTPGDNPAIFGNDNYAYSWPVSNNVNGEGICKLLVKGRDIAGNILSYEEAEASEAIGKLVLIDVEAPVIDAAGVRVTSAEFEATAGSFDDNFIGAGFVGAEGGYVSVEIWNEAGTTRLADGIWVNEDGSVDPAAVTLTEGTMVRVVAKDLAGNTDWAIVEVVPHEECCVYSLCPGFNMVAVSVAGETPFTANSLFPGSDVYKLVGGTYIPVAPAEELAPEFGYLVNSTVATDVTACGDPIEELNITGLATGWNMIGGPWTSMPTAEAGVYPAACIDLTNVHRYDCTRASYVAVTEFEHCQGHLVLVTCREAVTVMMPDTATSKFAWEAEKSTATNIDWTANLLIESASISRSLSFGAAPTATNGIDPEYDIDLFPAFPGAADAYLDNHLSKSIVDNGNYLEWTLNLSEATRIRADISNVPSDWDVKLNDIDLRTVNFVNLDAGSYKLTANRAGVPVEFSLAQNTPNPFNPWTSINYTVPTVSNVSVAVFNVLGENVRTLVNGVQEAGTWSVVWDGLNNDGLKVSSGVYFYKMTAGNYSETKKMTLIR